jgi:hypothetical protein
MEEKKAKLDDVLAGRHKPADKGAAFVFAALAFRSGKPKKATEIIQSAFSKAAALGVEHEGPDTLWVAGAAIAAGERALALKWLRADLATRAAALSQKEVPPRIFARFALRGWRNSAWLAPVRDTAIKELPAAEREEWTAFWTQVEKLLKEDGS